MVEIDRVFQHLRQAGFAESVTKSFCRRLRGWIRQSGPEWTSKRLKALKEYHLQQLSGVNPEIPAGWAVYHTRRRKVFKDPMVRMVMDLPNASAKALKKKEAFLRIYQVIRLSSISQSQRTKFMSAVTGPYLGTPEALTSALHAVEIGLDRLLGRITQEDVTSDSMYLPLRLWAPDDKRAPVLAGLDDCRGETLQVRSKSRRSIACYNFVDLLSNDSDWQGLWRRYPSDVSNCMVGGGETIPIRFVDWRKMRDLPAGKIGFIQEGGCKLRSVASPFLAIQALGEPLKRKLEAITRRIPMIGTFGQSFSHEAIIRWIQVGREVSSYDLSSFTDRFPFVLQEKVLSLLQKRGLISQFDVDVVKTTVNKEWVLPGTSDRVKWSVGQPLGFGPSFHLATLTHAALLRGLSESKLFHVVGDDVAIGDSELSRRYSDIIMGMGIEISTSKSVISREYAEFCGKLLSSKGVNPSIKVRLLTGADQLVTTMSYYGPRGVSFLSPSERKWLLKVLLPEDLGGLGWSLPGMNYSEWLAALNRDAIAEHRLRADLQEFLGLTYASWKQLYKWLLSFDEVNRLAHDPESGMLGVSPKGISGISATNLFTHGRVEGPSSVYRRETFLDLYDKAARETLLKSKSLPACLKILFNAHGYIDPRQKESNLPMSEPWNTTDGKHLQKQYTDYLHSTES